MSLLLGIIISGLYIISEAITELFNIILISLWQRKMSNKLTYSIEIIIRVIIISCFVKWGIKLCH